MLLQRHRGHFTEVQQNNSSFLVHLNLSRHQRTPRATQKHKNTDSSVCFFCRFCARSSMSSTTKTHTGHSTNESTGSNQDPESFSFVFCWKSRLKVLVFLVFQTCWFVWLFFQPGNVTQQAGAPLSNIRRNRFPLHAVRAAAQSPSDTSPWPTPL